MAPRVRRFVGLAAVLLSVLAASLARSVSQDRFLRTQRYEDVYYVPPPQWLKVLSLGHREALADLLWVRSLIYFGEELFHRGEVRHLYQYTDAMLTLDPYFKKVYEWVSSCALYRTGTITDADARRAAGYLERAVRLFPDDGELAWNLGATYSYELAPLLPDGPERTEAKRRGLEHLEAAALRGAGPPWLALSTAAQLDELGQREQEIGHLQDVYAQVSDPALRGQIEAQLARLRGATYAEALRRTADELEAARQRDFPYLDRDLHLLVRPRPPFDGLALLLRDFDPQPNVLPDQEPLGAARDRDAEAQP